MNRHIKQLLLSLQSFEEEVRRREDKSGSGEISTELEALFHVLRTPRQGGKGGGDDRPGTSETDPTDNSSDSESEGVGETPTVEEPPTSKRAKKSVGPTKKTLSTKRRK